MTALWIRDLEGNKAVIDDADRDRWALHGWSETTEPGDTDQGFVWMTNPDTGRAAAIPWPAREYWLGRGYYPSPPDEPVNPTLDPALTAGAEAAAETPPDGTVDEILAWVGDDPTRAAQAAAAEMDRDKPRITLLDALGRAPEPEQQSSTAAPAAPSKEA